MALKPEFSIMTGLTVAALVYAVYSNALPPVADVRTAQPGNDDVDAANKLAGWTAAGAVAGISLIAKDATVFILGGTMVVVLNWWHKHANAVMPEIAKAVPFTTDEQMQVAPDQMANSEDYSSDYGMASGM